MSCVRTTRTNTKHTHTHTANKACRMPRFLRIWQSPNRAYHPARGPLTKTGRLLVVVRIKRVAVAVAVAVSVVIVFKITHRIPTLPWVVAKRTDKIQKMPPQL